MSGQLSLFDPGKSEILSMPSYPAFKQALAESGCTRCGLAKGRANIVVDRGDPAARILAVGEGPGAEEDARGLAFVGRGGRLFDKMMSEVGLDTNRDLLIANVVKCRPPENRAPKAGEAAACLPFLRRQIALVAPKVIVLLGASALRFLLPAMKGRAMKDLVGKPFSDPQFPGATFLALYHPAFLLRDPRKVPETSGHMGSIHELAVS